jgi:hypothetical protein
MKKIYKKNSFRLLSTSLFCALALVACKKDVKQVDVDQKAAQDNAKGQYVFNNVNHIVDDAARSQGGVNKMQNDPCATYKMDTSKTHDSNYYPRTLTCTFDGTCHNASNDIRSGVILINFSGSLKDTGTVVTTTFQNYVFNGFKVEGTLSEKVISQDATTKLYSYLYNLKDGKITTSSGDITTLNFSQIKKVVQGSNKANPVPAGDAYELTGTSYGTSAGNAFQTNIISPLKYDASIPCSYLISGKLDVTPSGKAVRHIDFGNGTCSEKATVTIEANTFTINQSGK